MSKKKKRRNLDKSGSVLYNDQILSTYPDDFNDRINIYGNYLKDRPPSHSIYSQKKSNNIVAMQNEVFKINQTYSMLKSTMTQEKYFYEMLDLEKIPTVDFYTGTEVDNNKFIDFLSKYQDMLRQFNVKVEHLLHEGTEKNREVSRDLGLIINSLMTRSCSDFFVKGFEATISWEDIIFQSLSPDEQKRLTSYRNSDSSKRSYIHLGDKSSLFGSESIQDLTDNNNKPALLPKNNNKAGNLIKNTQIENNKLIYKKNVIYIEKFSALIDWDKYLQRVVGDLDNKRQQIYSMADAVQNYIECKIDTSVEKDLKEIKKSIEDLKAIYDKLNESFKKDNSVTKYKYLTAYIRNAQNQPTIKQELTLSYGEFDHKKYISTPSKITFTTHSKISEIILFLLSLTQKNIVFVINPKEDSDKIEYIDEKQTEKLAEDIFNFLNDAVFSSLNTQSNNNSNNQSKVNIPTADTKGNSADITFETLPLVVTAIQNLTSWIEKQDRDYYKNILGKNNSPNSLSFGHLGRILHNKLKDLEKKIQREKVFTEHEVSYTRNTKEIYERIGQIISNEDLDNSIEKGMVSIAEKEIKDVIDEILKKYNVQNVKRREQIIENVETVQYILAEDKTSGVPYCSSVNCTTISPNGSKKRETKIEKKIQAQINVALHNLFSERKIHPKHTIESKKKLKTIANELNNLVNKVTTEKKTVGLVKIRNSLLIGGDFSYSLSASLTETLVSSDVLLNLQKSPKKLSDSDVTTLREKLSTIEFFFNGKYEVGGIQYTVTKKPFDTLCQAFKEFFQIYLNRPINPNSLKIFNQKLEELLRQTEDFRKKLIGSYKGGKGAPENTILGFLGELYTQLFPYFIEYCYTNKQKYHLYVANTSDLKNRGEQVGTDTIVFVLKENSSSKQMEVVGQVGLQAKNYRGEKALMDSNSFFTQYTDEVGISMDNFVRGNKLKFWFYQLTSSEVAVQKLNYLAYSNFIGTTEQNKITNILQNIATSYSFQYVRLGDFISYTKDQNGQWSKEIQDLFAPIIGSKHDFTPTFKEFSFGINFFLQANFIIPTSFFLVNDLVYLVAQTNQQQQTTLSVKAEYYNDKVPDIRKELFDQNPNRATYPINAQFLTGRKAENLAYFDLGLNTINLTYKKFLQMQDDLIKLIP